MPFKKWKTVIALFFLRNIEYFYKNIMEEKLLTQSSGLREFLRYSRVLWFG